MDQPLKNVELGAIYLTSVFTIMIVGPGPGKRGWNDGEVELVWEYGSMGVWEYGSEFHFTFNF